MSHVQVGVPGAFTGTCHAQVPGYINAFKQFQEKGVDGIYIVAVNDVFVTKYVALKLRLCISIYWMLTRNDNRAWKENLAPDGTGEFLLYFLRTFAHARQHVSLLSLQMSTSSRTTPPRSQTPLALHSTRVLSLEVYAQKCVVCPHLLVPSSLMHEFSIALCNCYGGQQGYLRHR
jgi:hypothetical protein